MSIKVYKKYFRKQYLPELEIVVQYHFQSFYRACRETDLCGWDYNYCGCTALRSPPPQIVQGLALPG